MRECGLEEGKDFNLLKIERVRLEGNREVSREMTDAVNAENLRKNFSKGVDLSQLIYYNELQKVR